jgi:integrase
MLRAMQKGTIHRVGNLWMLRYREPVRLGGKVVMRPKAKKLANYGGAYRTPESVRVLADAILAPINAKTARPESVQSVESFLEHVYLSHVNQTKKPSTARSYLQMFRLVKPHVGGLELREVRTSHVDRIMLAVAGDKLRAHTTHRNVKSFLSGAFRYAKRTDAIAENPVRDSVVPRGKARGETPAYSLKEIVAMLAVLPEPARTAILTAAFTGLRVSEIKGLRWEDIHGDTLHVVRSVWSGKVTDTKTLASHAPVPLVPFLRDALADHRKVSTGNGYIFHGETGNPLRLENVVRRDIKPALAKARLQWKGWHAFRRGVGTNLHALGADDKTIQEILRHSNIAVTQALYIKVVSKESKKAMKMLERAYRKLNAANTTRRQKSFGVSTKKV